MEHNTKNIINIVKVAYNNLQNSDLLKEHQINLSYEKFFREFKIITFGLPRRSGKTSSAYELLKEYNNSILINGLRNSSIPYKYQNIGNGSIISVQDIKKGRLLNTSNNLIIIDNSRFIKDYNIISNIINNKSIEVNLIVEFM
jgi:hypothetical protein